MCRQARRLFKRPVKLRIGACGMGRIEGDRDIGRDATAFKPFARNRHIGDGDIEKASVREDVEPAGNDGARRALVTRRRCARRVGPYP